MGPSTLTLAAAALMGGGALCLLRRGLEHRFRAARAARLQRLGGTSLGEDHVRLDDGIEVRVRFRSDHRVELSVRAPVPWLESGTALGGVEGPFVAPHAALLHLALAREGLLRSELDVRALSGALEVGQITEALPRLERMSALTERVRRATCWARTDEASDRASKAVIRGLIDPDPAVRLAAARVGGSLGLTVLTRMVDDRRLRSAHRLEALEVLVARDPGPELIRVLERAALSAADPLVHRAVSVLGRIADGGPALVRLIRRGRLDGVNAVRAVRALAQLDAGETLLLEGLPHAGIAAQRAILEHLAESGSARAHVALDALLSKGGLGLRLDGVLRRAARTTGRRFAQARGALSEAPPSPNAPRGALSRLPSIKTQPEKRGGKPSDTERSESS